MYSVRIFGKVFISTNLAFPQDPTRKSEGLRQGFVGHQDSQLEQSKVLCLGLPDSTASILSSLSGSEGEERT